MADYTLKRIDDMEAVYAGAYKRARAELGVESFGMQVLDFPANIDGQYPEHDHADDGMEEVYLALSGTGEIEIEGERHPLEPHVMVRVGPGTTRTIRTAEEPLRLLALGAIPGKPYEAPELSQLGSPDPLQQRGR
jgi:mannose-6-phosphate isomerase-like protein (cupin superfamily)